MFKEIRNPDLYHGVNRKKNFFEGWYFKIVDKNCDNVFAFIPGIAKGNSLKFNHSFIQVLDGKKVKYNYIKFNSSSFKFKKDKFSIAIEDNNFSLSGISLNINNEKDNISGNIKFENVKKWPDSIVNPGSMGFYNYLTFMECYSHVCCIDGNIIGGLNINGDYIDFTGGKVYIEKNWGRSFPKSWIWIQSNSFDNKRVAFTCSIGRVPFICTTFSGFLVSIMVEDKFYKFTTINRSKMKIIKKDNDVNIVFTKGRLNLNVMTYSNKYEFIQCKGPKDGNMIPLVDESLNGKITVELFNNKINETIFKGVGNCAGIEYGGEMQIL
ncbi:tocopherol cyclase [Gottschalkia purinilytica]|uniref:Tocopherol cyclase n=1 Tax=Gottschalkia purinilytica TaxID=1503 RepID=A0A0L0W8T5_GOTPU|nr:tocopherol cyclase family protein [Gottschalkia purinilytica]KNF07861.1 tocopherol cyclase [Gottschalkia purinilytica]